LSYEKWSSLLLSKPGRRWLWLSFGSLGHFAHDFMFKAVILFAAFFAAGIFIIYAGAVTALRDGEAGSRYSSYNRRTQPFGFWFYVTFAILLGVLGCGAAVYILLHPQKI
jgi:hypothetical protein